MYAIVGTCVRGSRKFCRRGSTLITFFSWWGEVGSKYDYKWATIGPPAKRHFNGVSLTFRWWPNIECGLGSFVIFQEIRTSIAKKPYIFCDFSGGVWTPCHPPLDPRITCVMHLFTVQFKKEHIHIAHTQMKRRLIRRLIRVYAICHFKLSINIGGQY